MKNKNESENAVRKLMAGLEKASKPLMKWLEEYYGDHEATVTSKGVTVRVPVVGIGECTEGVMTIEAAKRRDEELGG